MAVKRIHLVERGVVVQFPAECGVHDRRSRVLKMLIPGVAGAQPCVIQHRQGAQEIVTGCAIIFAIDPCLAVTGLATAGGVERTLDFRGCSETGIVDRSLLVWADRRDGEPCSAENCG